MNQQEQELEEMEDALCDDDCDLCGGTGEVPMESAVYPDPGSPTADLGDTVPCPRCNWKDKDDL